MSGARKLNGKSRGLVAGAVIEWLEQRRLLAVAFVSIPNIRDVVFDDAHNILYATTSTGTVARYNAATKTLLSPWTVGGSLNGLDITPDGSTLYIADSTLTPQGVIRKVNTANGAVTNISYSAPFGDVPWDVAIGASGFAFVTPIVNGSGTAPLRQIDLATDAITTRSDFSLSHNIARNAIINRSADHSILLIQEPSLSTPANAQVSLYRSSTNDFVHASTFGQLASSPAAVNRNGSLMAVPRNGWAIINQALNSIRTNSSAGINSGEIFDPNRDLLYGVNGVTGQTIAFDTNTGQEKFRFSSGSLPAAAAMGAGQMAINPAGTLLFVTTSNGMQVMDIPQSNGQGAIATITQLPRTIKTGPQNLTVRVLDAAGEVAINYRGTMHFTSNNVNDILPPDHTFTAADAGQFTFTLPFDVAGGRTITAQDLAAPNIIRATVSTTVHNGTLTSLPITNENELVMDGPRNMLYISTTAGTIERYNLATQSMMLPLAVGNSINGFDIAADGNFIYAAEGVPGLTNGIIRKVNLGTGQVTILNYTYAFGETNPWDVVIAANGKALFSGTGNTTAQSSFRQIDLATDTISARTDVQFMRMQTLLDRSMDHVGVWIGGALESDFYKSASDSILRGTGAASRPGAVSRNSALVASGSGVIYSTATNLTAVKTLSGIDGGMVFDSVRDVFYGVNSTTDQIIAYTTNTWAEKYRINLVSGVAAASAMGAGQLAINPDATRLFLATLSGIRIIDIPQPTGLPASIVVSGFPKFVKTGVTRSITIRSLDPTGDLAPGYLGTVHFTSDDPAAILPADYTFTAADQGVHTFNVTFNTAGSRSITATDAANSFTATQTGITIHAGSPSLVPMGFQELVFDGIHHILYGSHNDGTIDRYELDTESLLPPFVVGGSLYGMDITPDGSFLYVADATRTLTQGRIRKVNTLTGEVTDILFTPVNASEVAYDIAIANNGLAFFTTIGVGGGTVPPLRQIDLATDQVSVRNDYPDNSTYTQLGRSFDRSTIMLQNFINGPDTLAFYNAGTDTWIRKPYAFLYNSTANPAAVSRDGSMLASVFDGITIMDRDFYPLKKLDEVYLDGGMVFDPHLDVFYAINSSNNDLVAYNTNTWAQKYRLPIGQDVSYGQAFGIGQLAITDDGTKAFLLTESGARVISIPQSNREGATIAVSGFPKYVKAGVQRSFTVTVKDAAGEIATNYRGTVKITTTDSQAILPANYTFTAADNGVHTFNLTFKTIGTQTITVTDTTKSSITGSQAFININAGGLILPLSQRRDLVSDPVRGLLYITTSSGNVERYDPVTQSLLSPIVIGNPLNGADITPDGHYLIVADSVYAKTQGFLHKIDLDTLAVTDLPYTRNANEGGAWDIAIAANGKALLSTESIGTGLVPLREIALATGTSTTLQMVHGHTHISRGESRNLLFLTDTYDNTGVAYTYDAANGTLGPTHNLGASNINSISSVNRNGTLIATELNGASILNPADLAMIANFPTLDGGILFDTTNDQLFGVNSTTNILYCYDTSDWSIKWQIPTLDLPTSTPLDSGVMAISGDGKFLFLSNSYGVQTFKVDPTPTIAFPPEIRLGTPGSFTVTMRDPAGDIDTRYRGSVHFTSDDPAAVLPADYTFTAGDAGVHSFNATLSSLGKHSVTVTDSIGPDSVTQSDILVYGVTLDAGVLTIFGTSGPDNIWARGEPNFGLPLVKVTLNGVDQQFEPADIASLNIQLFSGADFLGFDGVPMNNVFTLFGGTVDLGSGDDSFALSSGASVTTLTILGGDGNDTVYGRNEVNTVFDGGNGSDTMGIFTGSGDDTISISSAAVDAPNRHASFSNTEKIWISASGGANTFNVLSGSIQMQLDGSSGNDTFNLLGASGAYAVISSGNGDDTLYVGPNYNGGVWYWDQLSNRIGTDTAVLDATDGNDSIQLVWGGAGYEDFQQVSLGIQINPNTSQSRTSVFAQSIEFLRINGRVGNESIDVASTTPTGQITIDSGDGDDSARVRSASTALTFLGGQGNDTIYPGWPGPFSVLFDGGPGADSVYFASENTASIAISASSVSDPGRLVNYANIEGITLVGTQGNDVFNIALTPLPLTIVSSTGNDVFNFAPGGNLDVLDKSIILSDSSGSDIINLNDQLNPDSDAFTLTSTTVTRQNMALISFLFAKTVSLLAGAGNNQINVTSLTNFLSLNVDAGDGNDTISASGSLLHANLTVAGGNGDDTLNFAATGLTSIKFAGGSGNDTLVVNSGTYTLSEDAKLTNDNLTVNVVNGATLLMNASQHLAALRIDSGGRATLSTNGSRVLVTSGLDIAGSGRLDLTNNDLIVNSIADASLVTLDAIQGYLRSAYNGSPRWQGNGIASSSAAANPSRALGILLNSAAPDGYATFDGQSVDENSIIVAYTVVGDLNLDKTVSISDFIDLSSNFNQSGGWRQGDINYDQVITISDFIDLAANFGQSLIASPPAISPQPAASNEIAVRVEGPKVLVLNQGDRRLDLGRVPQHHQLHHRRHPHKLLFSLDHRFLRRYSRNSFND